MTAQDMFIAMYNQSQVAPVGVQDMIDTHDWEIKTILSDLDTGLRQVLTGLGDEINENQIIIESQGNNTKWSVTI